MKPITPFLWFNNQAEEAAKLYTSLFPNSKITSENRYDENSAQASGQPKGSIMTIEFELNGQRFVGLNGGPIFKFTEAVSFMVEVETQEELDRYWNTLIGDKGEESQCGWLKDQFGLSWQIVPKQLNQMLSDKDPAKAQRAMKAMLSMKKLNIGELEKAFNG